MWYLQVEASLCDFLPSASWFTRFVMATFPVPWILRWGGIEHCFQLVTPNHQVRARDKWLVSKLLRFKTVCYCDILHVSPCSISGSHWSISSSKLASSRVIRSNWEREEGWRWGSLQWSRSWVSGTLAQMEPENGQLWERPLRREWNWLTMWWFDNIQILIKKCFTKC